LLNDKLSINGAVSFQSHVLLMIMILIINKLTNFKVISDMRKFVFYRFKKIEI